MLSKRDRSFLNLAIKIASSSTMRHQHGCVVVRSGRVLSIGINTSRNHPVQTETHRIKIDCGLHAEVAAIKKCKNPSGATLYVARVNKSGEPRLSRPCQNCQEYIELSGIKHVIFTNS